MVATIIHLQMSALPKPQPVNLMFGQKKPDPARNKPPMLVRQSKFKKSSPSILKPIPFMSCYEKVLEETGNGSQALSEHAVKTCAVGDMIQNILSVTPTARTIDGVYNPERRMMGTTYCFFVIGKADWLKYEKQIRRHQFHMIRNIPELDCQLISVPSRFCLEKQDHWTFELVKMLGIKYFRYGFADVTSEYLASKF